MLRNFRRSRKNYREYRKLNEYEWRQLLFDSLDGTNTLPMPGFPPDDVQRAFVGTAGTDTIWEAWAFYSLMRGRSEQYGLKLTSKSHVLDFGCGWGRFARMFLHDVPGSNIYLADTWDRALEVCRETDVPGHRVHLPRLPPSSLPSKQFDLVFAYSVFSHLAPQSHLAWRTELARCIKPGGLAFITTQARWILDECQRYRDHPELRTHPWHEKLANSFVDYEASVAAYDRGEFLFASYVPNTEMRQESDKVGKKAVGLEWDIYGDSAVPAAYFETEWCGPEGFELVEFVTDRSVCEQAVAILRKV